MVWLGTCMLYLGLIVQYSLQYEDHIARNWSPLYNTRKSIKSLLPMKKNHSQNAWVLWKLNCWTCKTATLIRTVKLITSWVAGAHFSKVPITFRARKAVLCLPCFQSFNDFENSLMKLSVNEAKLTGLWARNFVIKQLVWFQNFLQTWRVIGSFEKRAPSVIFLMSELAVRTSA